MSGGAGPLAEPGQLSRLAWLQTLVALSGDSPAQLASGRGNQVSNRSPPQQRTPAVALGQSVPGQAHRGAGSPGRYPVSGPGGHVQHESAAAMPHLADRSQPLPPPPRPQGHSATLPPQATDRKAQLRDLAGVDQCAGAWRRRRRRRTRRYAPVDLNGRTGLDGGMAGVKSPRMWTVAGSYFEACNCEAICPCRRVGERAGGRSTYGICQFVLSWQVSRAGPGRCRLMTWPWSWRAGMTTTSPARRGGSASTWMIGPAKTSTTRWPRSSEASGGTTLRNFAAAIGTVHAVRRARAVSASPSLVHSRWDLPHRARRDTGPGARPGGLRHTRL